MYLSHTLNLRINPKIFFESPSMADAPVDKKHTRDFRDLNPIVQNVLKTKTVPTPTPTALPSS